MARRRLKLPTKYLDGSIWTTRAHVRPSTVHMRCGVQPLLSPCRVSAGGELYMLYLRNRHGGVEHVDGADLSAHRGADTPARQTIRKNELESWWQFAFWIGAIVIASCGFWPRFQRPWSKQHIDQSTRSIRRSSQATPLESIVSGTFDSSRRSSDLMRRTTDGEEGEEADRAGPQAGPRTGRGRTEIRNLVIL